MVHGVWICSWAFLIVAALSLGDDSPRSTYDETGNEVTSARLVLAPDRPECAKATTLTFCLDDAAYPRYTPCGQQLVNLSLLDVLMYD